MVDTSPAAPPATDTFEDVAATRASLPRALARLAGTLWRNDLRQWRPLIALALILTIIAKGLSVAYPVFLGNAINVIADGQGSGAGALSGLGGLGGPVLGLILAYGGARFFSLALPYLRDAFFTQVTQDANRMVAVEAYAHAQSLSLQFHLTRRAGALNRIIERGAAAMEYLLRFLAFNIGPTIIELALAAVVLGQLFGWEFAIIPLVTVAVYAVFTGWVTEWRMAHRREANDADNELRARATDTLTNFETVKAVAAEAREAARYDGALRRFNVLYVRLMRSLAVLNVGQEFIMSAGLLAVALLAGSRAISGTMGVGDVTTVTLMLFNIYRPLNILGWAWREIKQGIVDLERLFGLMDVEPQVADAPGARALQARGGAVRFEAVSFTHEGRNQGLQEVSFDIPPGAFVGLVGASGAGKSTILNLLFRFFDPDAGRVLIDGQDLREVTQASLRAALGLVPQDVALFNDTLRYNLAYARPDASEAEILEAARRAQLAEFIAGLPLGLETRVGERGLKLSGGEKQRVGVARAILRDPAILVLDEATSSLDTATEQDVQAALAEAARGRTTIAVAHRLSTIVAADLILVLQDGRVVEEGDHDTLLAKGGVYAAMVQRQNAQSAAALAKSPNGAAHTAPA